MKLTSEETRRLRDLRNEVELRRTELAILEATLQQYLVKVLTEYDVSAANHGVCMDCGTVVRGDAPCTCTPGVAE